MKTHQKIFIYTIVGIMLFSALALTALVFFTDDGTHDTDQEIVDQSTEEAQALQVQDYDELGVEDLVVGEGQALALGDTITVNYKLTLSDGTPVPGNDTFASGQPATFPFQLGSLIEGWTTGLVGMQVGGTRKLEVPSTLGYGAAGSPPHIPGNAGLIFEVQLVEIQ